MYIDENGNKFVESEEDFKLVKSKERFTIKCKRCGKIVTRTFKKHVLPDYKTFICGTCLKIERISNTKQNWSIEKKKAIVKKASDTYFARTGYRNSMMNPEVVNKVKDGWANKSPEEKERWRQQSIDFWANATPEQKAEAVLFNKMSKELNHGDPNYNNAEQISQTKLSWSKERTAEMVALVKKTKKEVYGDENYNNSEQMSQTKKNWTPERKQLMLDRLYAMNYDLHGDKYYNNSEQAAKTYFEKTGYMNSMHNPEAVAKNRAAWAKKTPEELAEIYNKAVNTRFENSGSYSILSGRMLFYGVTFDSTWELAVWIYCIDHNIPIVREPELFTFLDANSIKRYYKPDFMIDGKYVEIKGDHYFKSDGTMYFPFNRLHHNTNVLSPEEKAFMDDLYERKHQCGLSHGVEFWKGSECQPYIDYCDSMYPGWNIRFRKDNFFNPSYWCFSISNPDYFQTQYYQPLSEKGITPYEMVADDYQFVSDTKITPFDIK